MVPRCRYTMLVRLAAALPPALEHHLKRTVETEKRRKEVQSRALHNRMRVRGCPQQKCGQNYAPKHRGYGVCRHRATA